METEVLGGKPYLIQKFGNIKPATRIATLSPECRSGAWL